MIVQIIALKNECVMECARNIIKNRIKIYKVQKI